MTENPMPHLGKLRDIIDEVVKRYGLERTQLGFIPSEDGVPDMVSIIFKVKKEVFMSDFELDQQKFDKSFDDLVSGMQLHDKTQDKMEKAKNELQQVFYDWLDDDDN